MHMRSSTSKQEQGVKCSSALVATIRGEKVFFPPIPTNIKESLEEAKARLQASLRRTDEMRYKGVVDSLTNERLAILSDVNGDFEDRASRLMVVDARLSVAKHDLVTLPDRMKAEGELNRGFCVRSYAAIADWANGLYDEFVRPVKVKIEAEFSEKGMSPSEPEFQK